MIECLKHKQPPYICAPLTGETKEEVLQQLDLVVEQDPDIIEWRADFLNDLEDTKLVLDIIATIKNCTAIPLLFTIRAEHEGGEKITLANTEKTQLLIDVCEKSQVDFVDYETSNSEHDIKQIRDATAQSDKNLILSYHNFSETPTMGTMMKKMKLAEEFGADIAKLAVMPHTKEDVFELLEATKEFDKMLEIPMVTMSMGELGALSRVMGWTYGSIITFGVGVYSSAPGQIPVKQLKLAIQHTQEILPSWKS